MIIISSNSNKYSIIKVVYNTIGIHSVDRKKLNKKYTNDDEIKAWLKKKQEEKKKDYYEWYRIREEIEEIDELHKEWEEEKQAKLDEEWGRGR